jgi:hypothetical protein
VGIACTRIFRRQGGVLRERRPDDGFHFAPPWARAKFVSSPGLGNRWRLARPGKSSMISFLLIVSCSKKAETMSRKKLLQGKRIFIDWLEMFLIS